MIPLQVTLWRAKGVTSKWMSALQALLVLFVPLLALPCDQHLSGFWHETITMPPSLVVGSHECTERVVSLSQWWSQPTLWRGAVGRRHIYFVFLNGCADCGIYSEP